jgi:hypothetical protein
MSNKDSDINQDGLGELDLKRGQLTLPFTQEQFKEFVSGLFGKPEKIERSIVGDFEVELGDLISLYYLIEERIGQQNKGILGQFSAKIFYDDYSSILLNNLESLSNYSESRVVSPTSVELSWQYLIKFQDKNVPEKQEIEIRIQGLKSRKNIDYLRLNSNYSGFILRIEYTARTWATDIDSMLTEHIKNLMKYPNARSVWIQSLYSYKENIATISGVIFFLLSVVGGFTSTNFFISSKSKSTTNFLLTASDLDLKVDFLINYISGDGSARFYFFLAIFLLLMLAASIFIAFYIQEEILASNFGGGYILLTKKSKKEREVALRLEKNQFRNFLLTIVVGILVNIFSSYIFMLLITK